MFNLIGKNSDKVRFDWVVSKIKKLIPEGKSLLDVGAGELRFKPFCKHLKYTSQDFGEYDGKGDGIGLQTVKWDTKNIDIFSDIVSIPVKDNSFDIILCSEVLEHVPDALSALREFQRILKPGGTLLTTAPFNSLTHFAPYHFCGYNRYWYEHHLPLNGFKILDLDHNGSWYSFIAQELRRTRYVSKIYSSTILGLLARLLAIPIICILSILEEKDRGSNDLLCFGFMVKSEKL